MEIAHDIVRDLDRWGVLPPHQRTREVEEEVLRLLWLYAEEEARHTGAPVDYSRAEEWRARIA